MPENYGANLEDWQLLVDLDLVEDILPVVSNPNAEMSLKSNLKQIGKVPSLYNKDKKVAGIANWTSKFATDAEIERWSLQPDYGICLQTRRVRGIDIDVENEDKSAEILSFIGGVLKLQLPRRYRKETGKCLLGVRVDGEFGKQIVKVPGGQIEFISSGNQFVAFGTHPSGDRYEWEWPAGRAHDFPSVSLPIYNELILAIERQFGKSPTGAGVSSGQDDPGAYRPRRPKTESREAAADDSYSAAIERKGLVLGRGRAGDVHIACPWKSGHSMESGITETSYFPAGGRGYEQGHFKCLHASCAGRTDSEFIEALGLMDDEFEAVEAAELQEVYRENHTELQVEHESAGDAGAATSIMERPRFARDDKGKIWPTIDNICMAISHEDMCGVRIGFDTFLDDVMIADPNVGVWRSLQDTDYTTIQRRLERMIGFKPISFDLLRRGIDASAWENKFDSAINWITTLEWDGVKRIDTFMTDCFGVPESPYARAVSQYMWTAMAGRILQPGVKADMLPIFEGDQGTYKSTTVSSLVPREEFFVEISFEESDADLARKMRGKLVGEIGELHGLHTKKLEGIKTFIARTHEKWVPKYKEKTTTFPRRILLIGTTNEKEILADKTGHRRFLPIRIEKADIARVRAERDQLWAEGRARFELFGVEYQDAERLAKDEHHAYEVSDEWEEMISKWLHRADHMDGSSPIDRESFTMSEVLHHALEVTPGSIKGYESRRVGSILRNLGYERVVKREKHELIRVWMKK